MDPNAFIETAHSAVVPGSGLLVADESIGTDAGRVGHLQRARTNGVAALGKWDKSLEKGA